MVGVFEKELNGLMKIAAQNAQLTIHCQRVFDLRKFMLSPTNQKAMNVTIHFRDLFSEETKGISCDLQFNDGIQNKLTFRSTLHYQDVTDGQEKNWLMTTTLLRCRIIIFT